MLDPIVQAVKRLAGARQRTLAVLCGLTALALLMSPVKTSADSAPDFADRVVDHPIIVVQPGIGAMATGYTPAQIRKAYGIDLVSGDGTGKTIAIVDAYGSPTIEADLKEFCEAFGLPYSDEVLTVHYMGSGVPAVDPGWATETALDVEWAHAIAPGAKILLVEAESASFVHMLAAIDYANSQDVDVVSMSFGTNEWATSGDFDSHFSHAGTTYVASTGDFGAEVNWPAVSQKVVAVGGTSLYTTGSDGGTYSSETGWSGSGGGTSAFISKPAYQTGFQSGTKRGVPDVAMVADPETGVRVYDTTGQSGWVKVGGTSLSAPCWAGVYALAGQTGPAWAYSLAASATYAASYHDVTTGNNGLPAGTSYDLVTGLGTPKVNKLVMGTAAKLAFTTQPSASNVSGTAFSTQPVVTVQDSNGNPVTDSTASVTIAITTGTGTSGAVLSGTTTVSAVAGVATFSGLSIDKAGSGYTLKATSSPLTQATSSALAVAGTITVTSPNGGETWAAGTSQNITWSSTGLSATTNLKIEISYNSGVTWNTPAIVATTPNTGSKAWIVASTSSTTARVRISVVGVTPQATPGTSAADFTVTGPPPASVSVTSPDGGESWQIGTSHNITWTSVSLAATKAMKIELSSDGGATWSTIVPSTLNSGTKAWTVAGAGTANARVRVSVVGTLGTSGTSAADFSIPAPAITVTSPSGGENWTAGSAQNITWTTLSIPATKPMKIEISRNGGGTWSTIVPTAMNNGAKSWTVTGPGTANARIRISVGSAPLVSGTSGADFSVVQSVTVTSPVGGESWQIGTSHNITWTSVGVSATALMKIEISRDGGVTWAAPAVAASTPNSGTKAWTVTGLGSANARVRVSVVSTPATFGLSSADFTIPSPSVTVTSPNGGESWQIGSSHSITWTTVSIPSTSMMKIEVSRDGGVTWGTSAVAAAVPNNGAKTWIVTGAGTATALVRVSVVSSLTVKDVSDAVFEIPLPGVTVTSPNGGESWAAGTTHAITWTTVSISATTMMKIQISRDGGATWSTSAIAASTANTGTKTWTVTGPGTTNAIVRVSVVSSPTVKDESDAVFTIAP